MEAAQLEAVSDFDKEHVTPFIRKLLKTNLKNIRNSSDLRLTLDEINDQIVAKIFEHFKPNIHFSYTQIEKCIRNPQS